MSRQRNRETTTRRLEPTVYGLIAGQLNEGHRLALAASITR